eukprot:340371-Hanusia_phi.AAC.1
MRGGTSAGRAEERRGGRMKERRHRGGRSLMESWEKRGRRVWRGRRSEESTDADEIGMGKCGGGLRKDRGDQEKPGTRDDR